MRDLEMVRNYKHNPAVDLSLKFALKIIDYVELLKAYKKYEVGSQLLRAGCSISANIREAQNPESKLDFIHKMKIALKRS